MLSDAPDVEDAPGMSGDEGPRVLDTKLSGGGAKGSGIKSPVKFEIT